MEVKAYRLLVMFSWIAIFLGLQFVDLLRSRVMAYLESHCSLSEQCEAKLVHGVLLLYLVLALH